MKRTLFLSLLGLAASSVHADGVSYYKNIAPDSVSSFMPWGKSDLEYNHYFYQIEGEVKLTPDIQLINTGSVYLQQNYYGSGNYGYTHSIAGNGGQFFLNTGATSAKASGINYNFYSLAGVSFSNYTGYIDNNASKGAGLIAATAGNKHTIQIDSNYGEVSFNNNSLKSTADTPLTYLYSSVFTTVGICLNEQWCRSA